MVDAIVEQGFAIFMGLALAATCGLRAFLPPLVIGVLAALGKIELAPAFAWMASPVSLLCCGTATVAESLGDKFPAVDHLLDAAGTAIKPTAAAVAAASMVQHFDPLLALCLGLITGGAAAETVHIAKAKLRLLSTAFTGTLANPVLSTVEDVAALSGVVLALLVPAIGLVVVLALALAVMLWGRRRRIRRTTLA